MISNPEVNRTLATLRKAEFGFLGVIVEKLTDKSPLLPLYRTVHEIFTSYGSSFNSFEVIGSFSSFEKFLPSSTPSRRVTRTNSVTFSCSNWTLSFFDYSPRRRFFFLPNICGSNHDLIIRTRDLSRSIPLPPHSSRIRKIFFKFEFVHLESGLFYFIFIFLFFIIIFPSLFFFYFFFYSLLSFLKSHRFDPVESDPFSHWAKGTKQIRLIFRSKVLCEIFGFFLFRYPYPIGTAFESIKNLFFYICMNRYYYIPIPSRHLPRKIPNWIPNWRVSMSLSMRLCTLRIGIYFLKDPGFRALVGLRDPFDDLCCVEGISIWSDRLRKARGSNGTGESIQKRQFFSILLVFD